MEWSEPDEHLSDFEYCIRIIGMTPPPEVKEEELEEAQQRILNVKLTKINGGCFNCKAAITADRSVRLIPSDGADFKFKCSICPEPSREAVAHMALEHNYARLVVPMTVVSTTSDVESSPPLEKDRESDKSASVVVQRYNFMCAQCNESFSPQSGSIQLVRSAGNIALSCDNCYHRGTTRCLRPRMTQEAPRRETTKPVLLNLKRSKFACAKCNTQLEPNKPCTVKQWDDEMRRVLLCRVCSGRRFPCPTCGRAFRFLCHLKLHIGGVHNKRRDYDCDICLKSFSTQGNLTKHIESVHLKKKTLKCDFCPLTFFRNTTLRRHINGIHRRVKPIRCPTCPRRFTDRSNLYRHINAVHFRITQFICENCNQSFSFRANLVRHIVYGSCL